MPPPPPDGLAYGLGYGTSFFETITAAINDLIEHGYDSADRLAYWVQQIREAAIRTLTPPHVLERALADTLRAVYRDKIERGGILKHHPGVQRYTLANVAPRLRAELDRRILASAQLIRLNRDQQIADTIQRFSGWATSIPPGGTEVVMRRKVKDQIRKPLASLPFRERRVLIDQGHKFVANLNNIIANDNGAIALIWHSHWRERNYHYREDHKERDGLVYLIRGSWAQERGLVKVGDAGYYDQITAAGEEVYCRCFAQYLYSLRSIPAEMMTEKGRDELSRVRIAA
jgi:hypothetical protein